MENITLTRTSNILKPLCG